MRRTIGNMADRNGLRVVGWAYGALTAVVVAVALVVVSSHLNAPVEARTGAQHFEMLP